MTGLWFSFYHPNKDENFYHWITLFKAYTNSSHVQTILLILATNTNSVSKEIQNSISLSQFKNKLLKIIRPEGNSVYNISDIEGVRLLTKLHLKFSVLNEHKFRHNFDSLTPFCACGNDMEDNEHFLLRCPQFDGKISLGSSQKSLV